MRKKNNHEDKPEARGAGAGEPSMDPAEGDRQTVEESLRKHDEKGDLKEQSKKSGDKGTSRPD